MAASSAPPPGWYRDQNDPRQQRYWDGRQWTPYTQPTSAAADDRTVASSGISGRWKALRLRTKVLAIVAALVLFGLLLPDEDEPAPAADSDDTVSQSQVEQLAEEESERESEPEPQMSSVPHVAKASLSEARNQLRREDLAVRIVRQPSWKSVGTVLQQRVKAGREVAAGTVVTLVVAAAMPMVPGTVGIMGKEALTKLRKAGFRVSIVRETVTSGTTGTVLRQSPSGANRAAPGSVVEIVLASVVRPVAAAPAAPAPSNCTPGYSPCLAPASDYDCAGGSGDGPKYTGFVRVTGSDPYGLDADGDGAACESLRPVSLSASTGYDSCGTRSSVSNARLEPDPDRSSTRPLLHRRSGCAREGPVVVHRTRAVVVLQQALASCRGPVGRHIDRGGMSQSAVPLQHPIERCVVALSAALDDAAGSSPTYLSTTAKRQTLIELSRQMARLEGLRLVVISAAGDVAEEDAARSAGMWVAVNAGLERSEGRRLQNFADALERRCSLVAAALLEGEVSRPQAEVIVAAIDALPDTVGASLRDEAERHLVEQAAEFGPREPAQAGMAGAGGRSAEVAEEHEARALAAAERGARRRMSVRRREIGNGLVRITAELPGLHADLLYAQLHAYASPRRDHLENVDRRDPESGERVPYTRLLAHGFCTLERLSRETTPSQSGVSATVVVTIDQDKLTQDLAVAGLSTGTRITAGEARRLACNAGILPMVLAGRSRPLDVGRKKRFHDSAQRTAMGIRDGECRAAGCDIPAAWTEAHHLRPWSAGGRTSVDDGVLLCGFHHHQAHDRRYDMTTLASGDIRFHRRT